MAATTIKTRKAMRQTNKASAAHPVTKTADTKGRIAFGADFANKHVLIERLSETEVLVRMARVIPESEAWLYDNAAARNSVRRGLAQARAGELGEGPDIDADAALAARLED